MKKLFSKAGAFLLAHKIIAAIAIVAVAGGGYAIYKKNASAQTTTRYVFSTAKLGTITSAVTGSGQISAVDQIDVQSNVSGTINGVKVKAGDEVKKGAVLATIDDRDATNAVTTSELTVSNKEIAYQKAIRQNETQSATSSSSDLKKAYQSGYTAIANSFADFPSIFQDVGAIFYDPSHSAYFSDINIVSNVDDTARLYKYQAGLLFDKARKAYEATYAEYKGISADSNPAAIRGFLDTTYAILKDLSAGLTGAYSTIDYISANMRGTVPSQVATDQSLVNSYLNKVNSNMTAISNALTAIDDAQDKALSVDLDLKTAELDLKQARENLLDAQEALADHVVRAPFDGVVAKVPVEYGDKINNGGTIATMVTKEMQATLSLNEIDAAKIQVGDKATLSFDAIDGLNMKGTVSEVDVVGTVSQGVVSYGAKISLDGTDARIKPGMTTSVSIATGSRENVIVVPSSAVSVRNGASYIGIASATSSDATSSIRQVKVETGLASDDMVEIVSGLSVGDRYVARTITVAATKTAAQSATSLLGGTKATTGNVRTGTFNGGGQGGAVFMTR